MVCPCPAFVHDNHSVATRVVLLDFESVISIRFVWRTFTPLFPTPPETPTRSQITFERRPATFDHP